MQTLFLNACRDGQLNEAKTLISDHPEIDVNYKDNYAFREACLNSHLHVARWLVKISSINTQVFNRIFRRVCGKGDIEVAKWLLQAASEVQTTNGLQTASIDIHSGEDEAFEEACLGGHLEMAKWLHEISERPFDFEKVVVRQCCLNNRFEMLEWLEVNYPKYIDGYMNCDMFDDACEKGHLKLANWILKFPKVDKERARAIALFRGIKYPWDM